VTTVFWSFMLEQEQYMWEIIVIIRNFHLLCVCTLQHSSLS